MADIGSARLAAAPTSTSGGPSAAGSAVDSRASDRARNLAPQGRRRGRVGTRDTWPPVERHVSIVGGDLLGGRGMRQLTLILGGLLAVVAIGSGWIDEGEVVQLTTYDARAHGHETDLWIVDVDGRRYVRADLPGAEWLARLRADTQNEHRPPRPHGRGPPP